MKKVVIILIVIAFFAGFWAGQYHQQKIYLKRALELPEKDIFTNQDIEHILFNEPQL